MLRWLFANWNFNPLANLISFVGQVNISNIKPNHSSIFNTVRARTLRSSLWQKLKDSYYVYFGSELNHKVIYMDPLAPKNGGRSVGIYDYVTLMVPALIDKALSEITANKAAPFSSNLIFLVVNLARLIFNFLPRMIFSLVLTIVTSPIVLLAHAISYYIARPLKEKIKEECGDIDLDEINISGYSFAPNNKISIHTLGFARNNAFAPRNPQTFEVKFSTFLAFRQLNVGGINTCERWNIVDTPETLGTNKKFATTGLLNVAKVKRVEIVNKLLTEFQHRSDNNLFTKLPLEIIGEIVMRTVNTAPVQIDDSKSDIGGLPVAKLSEDDKVLLDSAALERGFKLTW